MGKYKSSWLTGKVITVSVRLAQAVGVDEALFLQQLHYWLDKSSHVYDGKTWVYNTHKQWLEQMPFWSQSTLRRVIDKLEKMQLIAKTDKYNKFPLDTTLWYTLNYDVLQKLEDGSDEGTPSAEISSP